MIGNAIPPKFTYFIAAAMREIKQKDLILPKYISPNIKKSTPIKTYPDKQSKKYPASRSFRFAIKNLNFKSEQDLSLIILQGTSNVSFFMATQKEY